MSKKVGRNDPCPCGSGKKFKQCHGRVEQEAPSEDSHEGAVERSLAWLELYHRKAWASAYEEEIGALVFDGLDEELDEAIADVLETLEPELRAAIYVNVTEWLLAEGEIAVKGERRRVTDLLLGPSGPALSPGQRDWVAQFAQQPLRLYEVTEVVPGSITVRDAVDAAEPPIVVTEHAGSESIVAGSLIATRVMTVSVGRQFSGAMYPFLDDSGLQLLASCEGRRPIPAPSPMTTA